MIFDDDDIPVLRGPDETWDTFADRCQRQLGNGVRVFVCKQVGVESAQHMVVILAPGPIRADLLAEVFK